MSAMFKPYGEGRTGFEDAAASGLTVTYFHLHEAQCVNVEPLYLCLTPGKADPLQVNEVVAEAP